MGTTDVEVLWDRDKSTNIVALNELVRRSKGVLRPGNAVSMKWGKEWWRGTVVKIIKKNNDGVVQKIITKNDEETVETMVKGNDIPQHRLSESAEEETDKEESIEDMEEEEDSDDGRDDMPLASYGMYINYMSDLLSFCICRVFKVVFHK